MSNQFLTTFLLLSYLTFVHLDQYKPDWNSLDTRSLPLWYDDAKFGVFMHWGLYSVPSYGSEWFWWNWKGTTPNPGYVIFMAKNYKPGFSYADFGAQFTAEFFSETEFASIVKKAGAKYFVLTSKHHEGYTMWPSNYSWNWNSWDVGPHRDLVGDLSKAMRAQGVRFGLYYSLFAWFHPLYQKDKQNMFASQEYVRDIVYPQIREIINAYRPEVLWNDGDWEASYQYWNATDLIAWLYNESPVKDTIVTNDRWGIGTTCKHGDFYTCSDKYNPGVLQKHKWENCMTIDRNSWGFRRDARYADFLSVEELIGNLVSTVSCGGNLLLNVGPTHYGKITPIFEERLTQIGQWLSYNGEAIYETKPWIYQNDTLTPNIWYTSKLRSTDGHPNNRIYNPQKQYDTIVYATVLKWPEDNQLKLGACKPTDQTKVTMLGYNAPLTFKPLKPSGLVVNFGDIPWTKLPTLWAWTLKLENLESDFRVPYMEESKIPLGKNKTGKHMI